MGAYFDYNATAPARPEVVEAVREALAVRPGNPSSLHAPGRAARGLMDEARHELAALVGARPTEVVFTSGATEANNLAIRGVLASEPKRTAVASVIEHHSVMATLADVESRGARVRRLAVDSNGCPDLELLANLCAEESCLLSLGWANGESGHVAPIKEILAAVAENTIVHLDIAQAAGRIPVSLEPPIAMLSLSAHKFAGPAGVGALIVADGYRALLRPLITGGPQESGLRAGTENLAGIVGMGVAAASARHAMAEEASRLEAMRESLWAGLHGEIRGLLRITPRDGLPNTLTVALEGLASDSIVAGLDLAGFAVSTGSACAAGSPEPSHVIAALGIAPDYGNGVIRISMGHSTTAADVSSLADEFVRVVRQAREAA